MTMQMLIDTRRTWMLSQRSGVFRGGGLCEAPHGRTAVIFVTIFGIIFSAV